VKVLSEAGDRDEKRAGASPQSQKVTSAVDLLELAIQGPRMLGAYLHLLAQVTQALLHILVHKRLTQAMIAW